MRWVATYKGEPAFNKADGLFNIDQIRKLGFERRNEDDWRYLAVVIKPEGYVIYETNLDISPRPLDSHGLDVWKLQYEELKKKILLDVIAELGMKHSDQEVVDLMQRFGFSAS